MAIFGKIDVTPFLIYIDHHLFWEHLAIVLPALLFSIWTCARAFLLQDSNGKSSHAAEAGIFVIFLFLITCGRWPHLFQNTFFSPDESQQIAGGITLLHSPIFWKYVDGHTAGPINFYLLSFVGLLGVPLKYFSVRVVSLLLQTTTLWLIYRIVRFFTSHTISIVAVAPVLCFYAWMNEWETIMYSTEQVSACLLAAGMYFFFRAVYNYTNSNFAWTGFLIGTVPWAKLQGAPIAVGIGVGCVLLIGFKKDQSFSTRIVRFGCLCIGSLATTVVFAIMIFATHQQQSFMMSYINANINYTEVGISKLDALIQLWERMTSLKLVIIGAGVWILGLIPICWSSRRVPLSIVALTAFTFLSIYACVAPGRWFPHYTLFLVAPFGALLSICFVEILSWLGRGGKYGRLGLVLFFITSTAPLLIYRMTWSRLPDRRLANYWNLPPSSLARAATPHLSGDDTLAVWGWYPHLYVETQAPQGVRDAHTERSMRASPQRAFYEERFLEDLEDRLPVVVVDAIGPKSFIFSDPNIYGLEQYPQIMEFISGNYRLVFKDEDGKVYLRNDR